MRRFTNLSWPDSPYGSEFRRFEPAHLLTALAVDWSYSPHRQTVVPASVSVVYLRVRPASTPQVEQEPLSVGFYTTAIETDHEADDQLAHLDKVLVGARRHATILAGHRLAHDLAQAMTLTDRRLPGVQAVSEAWADRQATGSGTARMVDTYYDVPDDERPELDVSLAPLTIADGGLPGHDLAAVIAVRSFARCVAIGVTAAVHTGRFRWDGTLLAQAVVSSTAWDVRADVGERDPELVVAQRRIRRPNETAPR